MKRITSAFLAIIGASWLSAAQAQVRELAPDVVVQRGLEPLLQMALRNAELPPEKVSTKIFPAQAAQRAFCLSGKAFMLFSTTPLPARLAMQCHAGLRASTAPQAGKARSGSGARPGEVIVNRRGQPIAALKGNQAQPLDGQAPRKAAREGAGEQSPGENEKRKAGARIVAVELGREPLVAVQPAGAVPLRLDERQLFMALAAWIPQQGRLVRNPYGKWSDLGSALPLERILILLPEDARKAVQDFLRRACEHGVLPYWEAQKLAVDAATFRRQVQEKCAAIRTDGAVQFVRGGDEAPVKELVRHRGALALLARGAWLRNSGSLRRVELEGDAPSRPVYLTVDTRNLKGNAIAGKVLPSLVETARRAGMLPPPPGEREILYALLAMVRQPDAQPGQDNGPPPQPAPGGTRPAPGAAAAAPPRVPGPRALGGGVRVEPPSLPPAGKAIDLMDLPPASERRP